MKFGLSADQAWAILCRHSKEEIEPLRLQELLRDKDRVSALVAVYNTSFEPSSRNDEDDDDDDDANQPKEEHRMLVVDLSRQRMTIDTISHLLRFAMAKKLKQYILQLAWGRNNRKSSIRTDEIHQQAQHERPRQFSHEDYIGRSEKISSANVSSIYAEAAPSLPSMHLALRVPHGGVMLLEDGTNALAAIHREWDRLERLSDSMRRGQLRGATGSMIRDVILIGRGTSQTALQFVYTALLKDERAFSATRFGLVEPTAVRIRRNLTGAPNPITIQGRTLRFLTTIDPIASAALVADLDPASTLVISLALNGNEETGLATKTIKTWLLQSLGSMRRADQILSKHMLLVTGNDRIVSVINKPERIHIVPEHSRCEAFTTFSPAGLLPLSIVFGWPLVKEFVQGAHNMDKHFIETNPRHNLPVLLALTDIWNEILLGASARVIAPLTEAFASYPKFVAALESQTCCRQVERRSDQPLCSSVIIDAALDGSLDRTLYQSSARMNTEIVMALDSQLLFNTGRILGHNQKEDIQSVHDKFVCSWFAHADELALGSQRPGQSDTGNLAESPGPNTASSTGDVGEGNRPNLLLMTGKLDAFACGQLVVLAEHRALVKAFLLGLDPFVQEPGSSLRMYRTDLVKEELQELYMFDADSNGDGDGEKGDERLNISSMTLLRHYATLTRHRASE